MGLLAIAFLAPFYVPHNLLLNIKYIGIDIFQVGIQSNANVHGLDMIYIVH